MLTASHENLVAGSTATMHADREGILVSEALLPRVFVSYLREREDHARVQRYHAGACIFVSSCIQAVLLCVPFLHSLNFERCSSPSRRRKALVLAGKREDSHLAGRLRRQQSKPPLEARVFSAAGGKKRVGGAPIWAGSNMDLSAPRSGAISEKSSAKRLPRPQRTERQHAVRG